MRKITILRTAAILCLCLAAGFAACRKAETPAAPAAATVKGETSMKIVKSSFGMLPNGSAVDLYTLTNKNGLKAQLMTYGAILVSLDLPDRNGVFADCVLGYDSFDGYLKEGSYFGAIVGRYGNRIAKGKFTLDGKTYTLATNNGKNHLHGGVKGYDKVLWKGEPIQDSTGVGVKFTYLSKDGEEGYPGNLDIAGTYVLNDQNELIISYEAKTDKPTVVNLTNHSFWNLTGGQRDILGHELMLAADRYTPVDDGLIPTGVLAPVEGTPMSFLTPTAIGARIDQVPGGYDHNYVLNGGSGSLALAARVVEPESGRVMEISTVQPGIQFYTGNFLDGSIKGKGGQAYAKHWAFCLETQHFPDSPNHPKFPSTMLRPGEIYKSMTVHKFSTK